MLKFLYLIDFKRNTADISLINHHTFYGRANPSLILAQEIFQLFIFFLFLNLFSSLLFNFSLFASIFNFRFILLISLMERFLSNQPASRCFRKKQNKIWFFQTFCIQK